MTHNDLIVVGVDGSPGSHQALRWAVTEAHRHGGAVQAITAWHWQGLEGAMLAATNPREQHDHAQRINTHEIDTITAEYGSATPITRTIVEGIPVRVLIDASTHARMLVLGSHGHNHLHHAILGSVTDECARQAHCPVVIIPPPHTQTVNVPADPVPAMP